MSFVSHFSTSFRLAIDAVHEVIHNSNLRNYNRLTFLLLDIHAELRHVAVF